MVFLINRHMNRNRNAGRRSRKNRIKWKMLLPNHSSLDHLWLFSFFPLQSPSSHTAVWSTKLVFGMIEIEPFTAFGVLTLCFHGLNLNSSRIDCEASKIRNTELLTCIVETRRGARVALLSVSSTRHGTRTRLALLHAGTCEDSIRNTQGRSGAHKELRYQ